MGVRLYPRTENDEMLEMLAEVPAGTMKLLKESKAREKAELDKTKDFFEKNEIRYKFFEERSGSEIEVLNNFLLYGWGKGIHPKHGCCGHQLNPEKVKTLLSECGVVLPNGIKVEDLEGVCWN